jgi:hypothetical protein
MLLKLVLLANFPADVPIATLLCPLRKEDRESTPTATLLFPSSKEYRELAPIDVLEPPFFITYAAENPTIVLLTPFPAFTDAAFDPIATFDCPDCKFPALTPTYTVSVPAFDPAPAPIATILFPSAEAAAEYPRATLV